MNQEWKWVNAVVPKMTQKLVNRYALLTAVDVMQPVGRRSLAAKLQATERVVRSDLEVLAESGLLTMATSGVTLTKAGQEAVIELRPLLETLTGVSKKERLLQDKLGLAGCHIVPGDSDDQPEVKALMGRLTNQVLLDEMPPGDSIVAVMGGTTMAVVSETLTESVSADRHLTFVPARGGMGESPAIQANTIAARMALATHGESQPLYLPELTSNATYDTLRYEPMIANTLATIERANVVIHCVGDAVAMAKRRQMPADVVALLEKQHVVGEAFGDFFDASGQIVYRVPKLGLSISDLDAMDLVVAVAGGHTKAAAIDAYFKIPPKATYLITDEGAADMILKK